MLMAITYLSNCFSWEGERHIDIPGGQEEDQTAEPTKNTPQNRLVWGAFTPNGFPGLLH